MDAHSRDSERVLSALQSHQPHLKGEEPPDEARNGGGTDVGAHEDVAGEESGRRHRAREMILMGECWCAPNWRRRISYLWQTKLTTSNQNAAFLPLHKLAPCEEPSVDDALVRAARALLHDERVGLVEAEGGGGQPVRDPVDPQELFFVGGEGMSHAIR